MSDEDAPKVSDLPLPAETTTLLPEAAEHPQAVGEAAGTNGTKVVNEPELVTHDAPISATIHEPADANQVPAKQTMADKPTTTAQDTKINTDEDGAPVADNDDAGLLGNVTTAESKSKTLARRKSGGVPEHKSRKLNKKQSKTKLSTTHTDAKPGDYYFIRLKGYPLWPAIICDESMLPTTLLKSRPVTALRADGTYREGYEDGGPKEKDRTFAVMYLHTNEFGWVPNRNLVDLDPDTLGEHKSKAPKGLMEAHKLAAEQNDLDYFKHVLKAFMEQREADLRAKKEAREAKEAAKTPKPKKSKSQKSIVDEDNDVDMPDADFEDEDALSEFKNKRKAEDENTILQTQEPSKKIKLSLKVNTPKAPNGTSTPKPTKETPSAKGTKTKSKKATPKPVATPQAVVPKEPELTSEEKRAKKEKEILFLRHKLQKGLLTRDQPPKEEEMKQMSEFVSKLEGYSELEVSIIRATKINKVLKAILKLPSIPKEEEFKFKSRSQTLLDKWNKLLATEQSAPAVPSAAANSASEAKDAEDGKPSPVESTNSTKEPLAKIDDEKAPIALGSPSREIKETKAEVAPAQIAPGQSADNVPETSTTGVGETTA